MSYTYMEKSSKIIGNSLNSSVSSSLNMKRTNIRIHIKVGIFAKHSDPTAMQKREKLHITR